MTTSRQTPYQVGQPVMLHGRDGHSETARVLAVHPHPLGGWEIIVRTTDDVDTPGRTVNVFTTGHRSSWLSAAPASAQAS